MARCFEALERRRLFCAVPHVESSPPASAAAEEVANGTWAGGPDAPLRLGEVAVGVIANKLYVVGEGDPATLVYDLAAGTWSTAAARPFPGNHHASEVINNKLYLFGGLTAGSEGEVQIYDPATGAWTSGADMPFAAGSSSSALIGGDVYVAGGIVGNNTSTTNRVARYDPDTNTWAEVAPMPQGRNHTAAATDGQKMYVFGGRGPGSGDRNVTTNGFDTVQVYDPAANTWQSSLDAGSTLAPLPQARGGMGKAVYLGNEFYVIGGETLDGPGATEDNVYHRVDVYDPAANTWRLDAPMPTARHGIFPVETGGKIYVALGGVRWGGSQSDVLEVFTPAAEEPPPPPPPPDPPAPPDPPPVIAATVVNRYVFYNNSVFDGNDPAANVLDDNARAPDKPPLLPGQQASFANYTSYAKGINGVMVDIANLPDGATLGPSDFEARTGNAPALDTWATAPAPAVSVRPGAGADGSDRVTLTWTDGQIQKTWLRVTVAASANTGLAAPDVFYFGNAPGETGNRATQFRRRAPEAHVNKADAGLVGRNRTGTRRNPGPAGITSQFDFDRDGDVDVLDRRVVQQNRTSKRVAPLALIVAP